MMVEYRLYKMVWISSTSSKSGYWIRIVDNPNSTGIKYE